MGVVGGGGGVDADEDGYCMMVLMVHAVPISIPIPMTTMPLNYDGS